MVRGVTVRFDLGRGTPGRIVSDRDNQDTGKN